jgi:hypothetical protein
MNVASSISASSSGFGEEATSGGDDWHPLLTTTMGGMLTSTTGNTSRTAAETLHRFLQDGNNSRGRTVLTILYLVVLGLCFVVPVFYYFRMHCEERYARRLRDLELAGITQALEQSQNVHREESRAARRKFREERRARINQLFAPVKVVCTYYNIATH